MSVDSSPNSARRAKAIGGTHENGDLLGLFLLDTCLISYRVYLHASSAESKQAYGTLANFLLRNGMITITTLNSCLYSLAMIAGGELSRAEALHLVRTVEKSGRTFWDVLTESGYKDLVSRYKLSLGELLAEAGIVSELDRITGIELSLIEGKQIGKVLVEMGCCCPSIIDLARWLQSLARQGEFTREQVCQSLKETRGIEFGAARFLGSLWASANDCGSYGADRLC